MTNDHPKSCADPLIDDMRERRRALLEACGHSLTELVRRTRAPQAQHPELVQEPQRSVRHIDAQDGTA